MSSEVSVSYSRSAFANVCSCFSCWQKTHTIKTLVLKVFLYILENVAQTYPFQKKKKKKTYPFQERFHSLVCLSKKFHNLIISINTIE